MSTTIEQFKEAFAGQTTDDGLQGCDRDFAKALKQLDQSIAAHTGGNGAGTGFQAARDRIAELYREARRATTVPARETAVQLDGLLRQANLLTAQLAKQVGESPPAVETPVAGDEGAIQHVTLQFHVQGRRRGSLENAVVAIGTHSATTDGSGIAELFLPPGLHEYRVTAEGFGP